MFSRKPVVVDTTLWVVGLGVTSLLSFIFSVKEEWQRREMISTSLLLAALIIYPVAMMINAINTENLERAALAFLTLYFSVFPAWRVNYIYRKHRKPKHG